MNHLFDFLLIALSAGFFGGYLYYAYRMVGYLVGTISETFYALNQVKRNNGWLFLMFTWTVSIPLMIIAARLLEQGVHQAALLLLSGISFIITGTAARYRDKNTEKPHYFGATIAMLSGIAFIVWAFGLWWILIIWAVGVGFLQLIEVKFRPYNGWSVGYYITRYLRIPKVLYMSYGLWQQVWTFFWILSGLSIGLWMI